MILELITHAFDLVLTLDKDFFVFTSSTVGVVPIKSKGEYIGKVEKLGTVRTTIN